jgi:chromosome segregation ATPase
MRKINVAAALIFASVLMLANACKSPEEKVDDAQVKVQDAKNDLDSAKYKADSAAQTAADAEEWALFKTAAQAKIKGNEIRISALKMKINKHSNDKDIAYSNSIDSLESENKAMQNQVDEYDKKQDGWASFKLSFNNDMSEIENKLKDLADRNKR